MALRVVNLCVVYNRRSENCKCNEMQICSVFQNPTVADDRFASKQFSEDETLTWYSHIFKSLCFTTDKNYCRFYILTDETSYLHFARSANHTPQSSFPASRDHNSSHDGIWRRGKPPNRQTASNKHDHCNGHVSYRRVKLRC